MPVPEKRIHDNELPVESTSASEQGKYLSGGKHMFNAHVRKGKGLEMYRSAI